MDQLNQKGSLHCHGSLQQFLHLLDEISEQHKEYPHILQQELKKVIQTGKDMVQRTQNQDRQTQTEEQQLLTDGKQGSNNMEVENEENEVSAPGVSDRPSEGEVEGSELESRAIKDSCKQNAEDKVELVSSYPRKTKMEEEQFSTADGQQRLDFTTDKGDENRVPTSGLDDRPSEGEGHHTDINDAGKKNVEDNIEAPVLRYARSDLEEELRKCRRDLEAKEKENETLMKRLAQCSEKQAKKNQRNVEETLSLNRQSRVEQDFKVFTSDERMDAFEIIQKGLREKTDVSSKRLTCMILEVVYEYILATKVAMIEAFKEISKFAVDNGPNIGHNCFERDPKKKEVPAQITVPLCGSVSEYPRDVLDELLLAIKESAPKIDPDIFLKDVKQEVLRLTQVPERERSCKLPLSEKLLDALDDYLKACIKLTWRMVTQVPPLRLEYRTFTYDSDRHKVVEPRAAVRTERYQGQKVFYLWPGLVDEGERIISAGEVTLQQ